MNGLLRSSDSLRVLRALRGESAHLRFRIERGTIADYDALARFHYRAGRPATCVRVLRAVAGGTPAPHGFKTPAPHDLAGVLVVSMPTLNGAWRRLAWPRRYDGADKRASAARLNAEVRTISRVVIDPRWRGIGLATRLVRAYLRRALTVRTEAPAAMGAACPFFASAGMREWRYPPPARDVRLARALEEVGAGAMDLLRIERRAVLMRRVTVRRALRAWAGGAGHTRAMSRIAEIATAAGLSLCAPRVAYTHDSSPGGRARFGAFPLPPGGRTKSSALRAGSRKKKETREARPGAGSQSLAAPLATFVRPPGEEGGLASVRSAAREWTRCEVRVMHTGEQGGGGNGGRKENQSFEVRC